MSDQKSPEKAASTPKSAHAEREERVLLSWKEKGIFEKTLAKDSPKGEFIFYEGPPTANGRPGIHHLEARAFKDAVPRYKTMRGYNVRRKGGWDTHGLPVELQVEKQLGLKSKKEIETYGIAAFNEKCKESVWTYVHEWEDFTARMGYWVDLKDPYITYKPSYIESLWHIVKEVDKQDLLYKDYKVVPWCPRCGTGLSSHELAQGYETVKDLSVTVKLELVDEPGTLLLAWTTTPWTLPGNVGLAVGDKIEYCKVKTEQGTLILAKDRMAAVLKDAAYTVVETIKGFALVGRQYKPPYPFLKDNVSGPEKDKLKNAFRVYAADFVTTADGTGIVHIAPMYGQDDFELGTDANLPKYHLVNEDGTFKGEAGFLAGKFVREEKVAVEIIKDLAHRGLLFHKEKHEHTYPHCWRCHTPLIYFARDSWYIRMSALRHKLVKENEDIHWEPDYIKDGRFGEWLREVKDWAISRERYWGTPLPVWSCEKCSKRHVVGSVDEIAKKPKNQYWVMRHGEAENNVKDILNSDRQQPFHLTEKGKERAMKSAQSLKKSGIDYIFVSPFIRTQETANIVQKELGLTDDQVITDERLREMGLGKWNGAHLDAFLVDFPMHVNRYTKGPAEGESYIEIKKRMGDFIYDIESRYADKKILIITHGSPAMMLMAAALGWDRNEAIEYEENNYISKAEVRNLDVSIIPHNEEYELDLHRPYIDQVTLPCSCGGEMKRVKEVMDVWFDSGAMPFAQDSRSHEKLGSQEARKLGVWAKLFGGNDNIQFPADFICEAIDQTRGWFYTLHAVAILMRKGKAYKNVICLGHVLDAQGKKMSKHIGNVVSPWEMMDKYGADALRFWMYSINQPGEPKNFDEKTVDEVIKKVFNLAANVSSFYKMYEDASVKPGENSNNVLDRWILAKLNELISTVTKNMEAYVLMESTRAIRDFIADLSQWYLRRSRDRFKGDNLADKKAAIATTRFVLLQLSKVMAPFTPFFAETLYREVGGELESVHLETWPEAGKVDSDLIVAMTTVRDLASKGLEARMAAKINVRQPLAQLKVQSSKLKVLTPDLIELVKDEVNVKEVVAGNEVESVSLDTNITPELKEEGELRELIRSIQDLRKAKGLSVGDAAGLFVPADKIAFVRKHELVIKKATNINSLEQGSEIALKT